MKVHKQTKNTLQIIMALLIGHILTLSIELDLMCNGMSGKRNLFHIQLKRFHAFASPEG